ncbi:MAG: isocitrate lyase/phosphoenolpyruvate mutase family protein [Bryobacterales bacterium]|nr:isocitrate lyase/phosphoenolpyruvate mutase family protein [Bryobacterales bacterium]
MDLFMARRRAFRALHESGCFVIPNPWDVGSAMWLQALGFPALATTSSGLAFSLGLPDAEWAVSRDRVLSHVAAIVASTDLPVNADFESGYAVEPEPLMENVRLCIETGVAGLSIEDNTGNPASPLFDLDLAVERIRTAKTAIKASGANVLLTARAECYLVGHPQPLAESLKRLTAYAEAGADVLYAPGPKDPEEIRTIVRELHPKPVNLLIVADWGITVAMAEDWGVRRISTGSALCRAAWGGFLRAAREIAGGGSFTSLRENAPFAELNEFFQGRRGPG